MEQVEVVDSHPVPAPAASRAVATTTPHDLLRIAVEGGADIEKLERLMALQERWEANEARKAYNDALANFKAEAVEVIKRKLVDFATAKGRTTYKHAELSDVVDVIGPALSRHGLSFTWSTKQDKGWIEVTCTLRHRMGHSESVSLSAPPDESGGKNNIQAIISTTTYLERHTLKAITGVAEKGQDDDGRTGDQQEEAPEIPAELMAAANAAAQKGAKAFTGWWKKITPEERKLLRNERQRLFDESIEATDGAAPKQPTQPQEAGDAAD